MRSPKNEDVNQAKAPLFRVPVQVTEGGRLPSEKGEMQAPDAAPAAASAGKKRKLSRKQHLADLAKARRVAGSAGQAGSVNDDAD